LYHILTCRKLFLKGFDMTDVTLYSVLFSFQVMYSINRQCLLLLILVELPWDDRVSSNW
jgi:hypothetical protein